MGRSAIVTGVAGQDGTYLARHLVAEGYDVVGTVMPGAPHGLRPYIPDVEIEDARPSRHRRL